VFAVFVDKAEKSEGIPVKRVSVGRSGVVEMFVSEVRDFERCAVGLFFVPAFI
jgi:hypothetical protein